MISLASAYTIAKIHENEAKWWIEFTRKECRKLNKEKSHNDKFFFEQIYKGLKEDSEKRIKDFAKAVSSFKSYPTDYNYTRMIENNMWLMTSLKNERRFCNR